MATMTMEGYKKKKTALAKKRNAGFAEEQEQEAKARAGQQDDRIFSITRTDEDVVIRFLPQGDSERKPRIKLLMHWLNKKVNGKDKYLRFKCRKTLNIDNPCPSDDVGKELWDNDKDHQANKPASAYYRKDQFVANILIVDDPNNEENNGQVKIFKFGRTIEKMIQKAIKTTRNPKTNKITSKGIDIFDLIDGVNFNLKCVDGGGNNTYDDSCFDTEPSPVADNNKDFSNIIDSCYNLDEIFLDESTFLSEEEVQKRFDKFENDISLVKTRSDDVSDKEEVELEDDFVYNDDDSEDLDFKGL